VTTTKDRQRAAARAKLEREMAQRAEGARRRRRTQLIIAGGVVGVLVVVGTVWIVANSLSGGKKKTTAAAPITCTWTQVPKAQQTATTKDVGVPPTKPAHTGTQVMTVTTNFGAVEVTMDLSKVPCTAQSMGYLASKQFFDGTKCHREFTGVLQCGDPSAKGAGYRSTDGTGGPSYRFGNENLPTAERPAYPAGVVAMANSGSADTNGSQFFFVFQDVQLNPDYTVLGKITKGIDVLQKATASGDDQAYASSSGGGHPKKDIDITSLTVTPAA
jgi:peptidyl-prolyl cis-trans isomerase B (cyclophilin B)